MKTVHSELLGSIKALAKEAPYRSAILENVYWASCEGLLQGLLLAGFNARASKWLMARERSLARGWTPDLIAMEASQCGAWWNDEHGDGVERRRRLARAVFEVKIAWTWACGTGNASLTRKSVEVQKNLSSLRTFQAKRKDAEAGMIIAVAGGAADPKTLAADLSEAEAYLKKECGLRGAKLTKSTRVVELGAGFEYAGATQHVGVRVHLFKP